MENLNETQDALYEDNNDAVFEPIKRLGPGIVVRAKHWLSFGSPRAVVKKYRRIQEESFGPVLLRFKDQDSWKLGQFPIQQTSVLPLPDEISLVSLEQLEHGRLLLRLAHKYSDIEGGVPVNVSLSEIFSPSFFNITDVKEMNLSGTRPKSEINRLQWKTKSVLTNNRESQTRPLRDNNHVIVLNALEIRTFILSSS